MTVEATTPVEPVAAAKPRRSFWRWLRTWLIRLSLLGIFLLVAAELFARFYLGLGDPPLSMADPQIEYLYKPSATYHRFGNTITYNQWSMRSDDFPQKKADPNEFRVMVLGDSIVNGGAHTDQSELATTILQQQLRAALNRPVIVGNISAGSWGPANLLAYVNRFGLFDADAVIIVLSSHDAADVRSFEPLGRDLPEHSPVFALQEVVERFLPPLARAMGLTMQGPRVGRAPRDPLLEDDKQSALADLKKLFDVLKAARVPFVVFLHSERDEKLDYPYPGCYDLMRLARDQGVELTRLGPAFRAAQAASGHVPYRDTIHPDAEGQRIIEQAMEDWVIGLPK